MRSRKLLTIFLVLIIAIVAVVFVAYNKEKEPQLSAFELQYGKYKPKMWLLEDEATGGKIYLFGSIHIGVEGMYPLPDRVMAAFNQSEILAVENDIVELEKDLEYGMKLISYLTYSDGTTLKDHVEEGKLNKIRELCGKYGVPVFFNGVLKPIFYHTGITQAYVNKTEYATEYGVDRFFLEEAKAKGMKVEEIEDAEVTYQLLGGLSEKTEQFLVDDLIHSFTNEEVIKSELDAMYKGWVNGELDVFIRSTGEAQYERYQQYKEEMDEYEDALLNIRNVIMVDKIIEYLATGSKYFYVVGAFHFEGEKGMIQLLETKGYSVKRIDY